MVRSLILQLQVVHALMVRETRTRFGTHRLGYIWAFVGPLTFIGLFAASYLVLGRLVPMHLAVVPYLASGFVPFAAFRETAGRSVKAIASNQPLLFYASVRPLDLVIARVLLEAATQVVVFALLMGGYALYEGTLEVDDILQVIVGFGLAVGLGGGFGLLMCSLTAYFRTVEQLIGPLLRPLFWISGLFFPIGALPRRAQELLLYNPLAHAIDLVRDGWFPRYHAAPVNITYPLMWILTMTFLGLFMERGARRRVHLL